MKIMHNSDAITTNIIVAGNKLSKLRKELASRCRANVSEKPELCPVGILPCPFISFATKIKTRCADITKDDWDAALRDY